MIPDTIKKHSVVIRGHKTAISIEDAFWLHIKRLAKLRGGMHLFFADVDANRKGRSLSSSLRIAVLEDLQANNAMLMDTLKGRLAPMRSTDAPVAPLVGDPTVLAQLPPAE